MTSATLDLNGYAGLALTREDRVLTVAFNRPEQMNPLTSDDSLEIIRLMRDLASDEETRVVILTGAGRAFSAGGDLSAIAANLDRPDRFIDHLGEVKDLLHAIIDCPKPIIAKVNGAAMGLGATIALFCDMIFMAEEAKIADTHVKLGLVPGDGGSIIWPMLMGLPRAKQFLFTGQALTGKDAERLGLINEALPLAELDARVGRLARELAAGPPRVLQFSKIAMNAPLKRELSALMDVSYPYEILSAYGRDHAEAVHAFIEKRAPNFSGR